MRAPFFCGEPSILAGEGICAESFFRGCATREAPQDALPDRHRVARKFLRSLDWRLWNLLRHSLCKRKPLRRIKGVGAFANLLAALCHEFEPHRLYLASDGCELPRVGCQGRGLFETGQTEFTHHFSHRFALHVEEGAEWLATKL